MMEGEVKEVKKNPYLSLLKLEISFSERYSELLEKCDDDDFMEIIESSKDSLLKRINSINGKLQKKEKDESSEDKDE